MANSSQLPVEEIGTQTGKIGFINFLSVSIRNTFKIAVKAGFLAGNYA